MVTLWAALPIFQTGCEAKEKIMFNMKFQVRASNAYELLDGIRRLILEEPLRINMNHFYAPPSQRRAEPRCGMVGCIGGWTNILTNPDGDRWSWDNSEDARLTLGLTQSQAYDLFWDRVLITEAGETASGGMAQTFEHAQHVADHIERFQKRYEAQLKAKTL
jgi:hypothetical protein